ncbi:hypothetical protein [Glycomyces sp. MUSA5-2]|uniref:hypothetical protein n=1 Tax=Glycomyces sp. MUSA5-2 TaxID=2053002 RepID=UPI0030089A78
MTRASMHAGPSGDQAIGIDNQGGVIHNVNLYQQTPSDNPARNLEVGIELLSANLPRRAAHFLAAAYEHGVKSNRLLLHWALAILSGRSDIDLSGEEVNQLEHCINAVDYDSADKWSQGMEVVAGLLQATVLSRNDGLDQAGIEEILRRAQRLDADIRSDVLLHLDRIVSGSLFEYLWADHSDHVGRLRNAGNRKKRVPKFFIQDQSPPRMPTSTPYRPKSGAKGRAVGGCSIAAVASLLVLTAHPSLVASAVLVVVSAAAAALVVNFGKPLALRAKRIDDLRIELRGIASDTRWPGLDPRQLAFHEAFARLLAVAFETRTPTGFTPAQWLVANEHIRGTMAANVTRLYCDGRTQPGELRWLAEHLAKTQAGHMRTGLLWDPRFGVPDEDRARLGVTAGAALFAATGLFGGVPTGAGGAFGIFFAAVAIAGGLWLALPGVIELAIGPHYYAERRRRADEAFRQASQTYSEWADWLLDRPEDTEMAQWLAADLSWLRIEAMNALRLTHQDVIAHFAITEPADDARAARVPFGPTRYSSYRLRIFLLTENGVRVYGVELDFTDGSHFSPTRDNFRYDVIVSARVVEIGVRYGESRRAIVDLDRAPHQGPRDFTLAHALSLRLQKGELKILIGANRNRDLVNGGFEDPDSLLSIDIESSGIGEGLRILQAVAGEGKGWIETERARQRQVILKERRRPSRIEAPPTARSLALEGPESAA